ncbi:hypothetical protein EMIHUDRAFT_223194 [Emiliania huxleyi CCMP1516]|uniref:SET domain-containing protein n=2 Tax=Emiliania huxleyi TaxID=2903 RepID=A0A0D3JG76_EMIH1|nr:hypothetical protein EMIHUDRAFT_240293 [Emiliania huxleyi CCMP1516]XP_005792408.1 hypothetical protein EMIHUDRAFT_223194 [Emiliania huxleyi CCMP1516]EOD22511.1 hypothetical protein EMIHUDRAFT_240293 [Emiliania huxleyi CCMP1516]EOD39979.1 hypothetical protein EMIHUDRAFT_223194 [Emiliania huxleyi CCMP1516]|eukprot:XP_005774940.1 hypothetical protein EMIHUDRAFT_240293 [Emiliania huxleyi CCMP1516]
MELAHLASSSDALEGLCGSEAASQIAQNHFVHPAGCLLFRRISLINHSCVPNASIRLCDNEEFAHVIVACDVAAEEEIVLCYSATVLFAAREMRQSELHSRWGFTCECARCSGTLAESEVDTWRMLENAALSAQNAKPRGPVVDPSIVAQQHEALARLETLLPHLCELERFRFDAAYFAAERCNM